MKRSHSVIGGIVGLSLIGMVAAADDPISFSKHIRPILSNHCFQCHGPDENKREADLRLDSSAGATMDLGGYAAIMPGVPGESELLQRISTDDEDLRMPPADHAEPLTKEQIQLLTDWIKQGASFDQHWSFQPIVRPTVPTVSDNAQASWKVNPIDAFVFQKLEDAVLSPSAEADQTTLVRRVYLDLLGLPPTIQQLDAYLNDDSPTAYDDMVARALNSKHFGERWGRHWLDQARYADSHGYTNDNERSMWPYRDWVIEAFNRDLPFDQFTIEQLAGDLLEHPTLEQRVATGFHRNTLINSEGGTKADQFRDEQVKDRIDTTGLVWMGLTVGCAKCHSHKFDPLSQEEYYSLYAYFNSTADNNSVTPNLKVPSQQQTDEISQLRTEQQQLQEQIANDGSRAARQAKWEHELLATDFSSEQITESIPWTVLELSGKSDKGSTFESLPDKSLLVSGQGKANEEYQATARSPLTTVRSVRLEVLPHESLPEQGPGRALNGNFALSEFWFRTGDGRELRFSKAAAEHSQPKFSVHQAIDGKTESSWAIGKAPEGKLNCKRTAWFVLPKPLEVEELHALVFKMQFFADDIPGIGRYRLSISDEEWIERPNPQMIATLLGVQPDERSPEQQAKIDKAFVQSDPFLRKLDEQLEKTSKRIEAVQQSIPTTMVLEELDEPRTAYVQVRGDFLRRDQEVQPAVPSFLALTSGEADGSNRLAFARWLVSENHPLTSRVRVNRIWMRLFGRGLVETENDFGIQGSLPTHPELLDWLSSEFIRDGWSTKRLLHLIMTSATYRQSSQVRPDLQQGDPRNLLLGRQTRLRVEAEIVRDIALAVSGRLSPAVGGPSVFPPQPAGVYAFTQRKKDWKTSRGADRYRRGMYTFFYRSAPYPMLTTFDVPKFNQVCTCRDRSNTPLQSLTMANSESLLELAEHLGKRIQSAESDASTGSEQDSDAQRIAYAYRLCFSRLPTSLETERVSEYVQACRVRFGSEAKAWLAVARVLMNLDEFVTRE